MTNELQIFKNPEFGSVRIMMIKGESYFVGKDVAIILGYSNPRDALAKHVDNEDKGVAKCDTLGGVQDLTIINESGLFKVYHLDTYKHPRTSRFMPTFFLGLVPLWVEKFA